MKSSICIAVLAVSMLGQSAFAALAITEVASTSGAPEAALSGLDWWELTNTGPSSVLLNGYEWEDNNPQGAGVDTAIFPDGITIAAGESIIIHDGDSAVPVAFRSVWGLANTAQVLYGDSFGGNNMFSGLSSSGDQVNLYDNLGSLVSSVTFGASTSGVSFEWDTDGNTLGLSVAGENGAYLAPGGAGRISSPPGHVPEPASIALVGMAVCGFWANCGLRRRK
jgi:Lamin Tail Domain/PEP-CTERM motif